MDDVQMTQMNEEGLQTTQPREGREDTSVRFDDTESYAEDEDYVE